MQTRVSSVEKVEPSTMLTTLKEYGVSQDFTIQGDLSWEA